MNYVHRIPFLDVFSTLSYEFFFQDYNAHMIIFIEYAQYKNRLVLVVSLTIIPRAQMAPESIAHEAEGRMGY